QCAPGIPAENGPYAVFFNYQLLADSAATLQDLAILDLDLRTGLGNSHQLPSTASVFGHRVAHAAKRGSHRDRDGRPASDDQWRHDNYGAHRLLLLQKGKSSNGHR